MYLASYRSQGIRPTTRVWEQKTTIDTRVGASIARQAKLRLELPSGVARAGGVDSAANAVNDLNLNKSLASQQQLSQLISGNGINIAGNGTSASLRDAPRLVSEYGGKVSNWSKVSSASYTAADGSQFEIRAYRNAVTGQVVEPKSIPLR